MSIDALDGLDAVVSDLESRLAEAGDNVGSDADAQAMSAALTGAKTRLVGARTAAERAVAKAERAVAERAKRRKQLAEYQAVVLDLEHWAMEARGKLDATAKLATIRAVKDDIHTTEVSNINCKLPHTFFKLYFYC